MVLTLGKDTSSKSFSLTGDTGQYILLGGIDENGNNVDNDLTILFLEIISELRIPDPKVILRVNSRTSDEVWIKAIECLATGCGSPLIINEDVVMKGMVEFGYSKKDVWNLFVQTGKIEYYIKYKEMEEGKIDTLANDRS